MLGSNCNIIRCWGSQTTPDHTSLGTSELQPEITVSPFLLFLMFDTCENLDILALIKIAYLICFSENTLFFNIFLIDGWKRMNFMSQLEAFNFFFKLLFIF